MTTEQKVKWEEIDSLDKLKVGDELEYVCPGTNKEFKYWGKVIDIERIGSEVRNVRMEGDWVVIPSSLTAYDGANKLTRKVKVFVWPDYIGACVEAKGDTVHLYVRVESSGHREWVGAETGEFYATWEVEVITSSFEKRVIGRGY